MKKLLTLLSLSVVALSFSAAPRATALLFSQDDFAIQQVDKVTCDANIAAKVETKVWVTGIKDPTIKERHTVIQMRSKQPYRKDGSSPNEEVGVKVPYVLDKVHPVNNLDPAVIAALPPSIMGNPILKELSIRQFAVGVERDTVRHLSDDKFSYDYIPYSVRINYDGKDPKGPAWSSKRNGTIDIYGLFVLKRSLSDENNNSCKLVEGKKVCTSTEGLDVYTQIFGSGKNPDGTVDEYQYIKELVDAVIPAIANKYKARIIRLLPAVSTAPGKNVI